MVRYSQARMVQITERKHHRPVVFLKPNVDQVPPDDLPGNLCSPTCMRRGIPFESSLHVRPMCHYWPRVGSSLTSEAICVGRHPAWCVIPELQCALGNRSIATQQHPGGLDKECLPREGRKTSSSLLGKPSTIMGPKFLIRSSSNP